MITTIISSNQRRVLLILLINQLTRPDQLQKASPRKRTQNNCCHIPISFLGHYPHRLQTAVGIYRKLLRQKLTMKTNKHVCAFALFALADLTSANSSCNLHHRLASQIAADVRNGTGRQTTHILIHTGTDRNDNLNGCFCFVCIAFASRVNRQSN